MKARLKFSKVGSMRFIGHLDVMRYFQKAFRRAGIPVLYSQGFSPHPLMSFTSPLGIGLSSDAEYLDFALDETAAAESFGCQIADISHGELIDRLNNAMNDEIHVNGLLFLEDNSKPSMATLAGCDYLISVKKDKDSILLDSDKRKKIIKSFLQKDRIEILKKTKRSEKTVDIKKNIYFITDDKVEFESMTGRLYDKISLESELYKPVLYMQLTAGSIVNIKPETVLDALLKCSGSEYDLFAYQVHRLEMYADADGVKGEVHTLSDDVPCRLVPMSAFNAKVKSGI